jgi:hypothetical protein
MPRSENKKGTYGLLRAWFGSASSLRKRILHTSKTVLLLLAILGSVSTTTAIAFDLSTSNPNGKSTFVSNYLGPAQNLDRGGSVGDGVLDVFLDPQRTNEAPKNPAENYLVNSNQPY